MNSFKVEKNYIEFKKIFLDENSKHNLISKNDEKLLYEKHIYDSLALKLFLQKYDIKNPKILDIGCGGGFPCVPLAIEFPNIEITGIDSIRKKINSINVIKDKLELNNLNTICDRVENIKNKKFDIIVSRAVADLDKISNYALPLLSKNGFFVAYKSKKALDEIEQAQKTLKKHKAKVIDIIDYTLPLDEIYERNLIVITSSL